METISSFANAKVRDRTQTYVDSSQKQRGDIVRLLPRTPRSFQEVWSKLLGFLLIFWIDLVEVWSKFGRSLVVVSSKFGRSFFEGSSAFGRYF